MIITSTTTTFNSTDAPRQEAQVLLEPHCTYENVTTLDNSDRERVKDESHGHIGP